MKDIFTFSSTFYYVELISLFSELLSYTELADAEQSLIELYSFTLTVRIYNNKCLAGRIGLVLCDGAI